MVAEAAVRDCWGDPAAWLRETEAFFSGRGYANRVARECRALLTAAGAPGIRRGRGGSTVPPALRRLGITSPNWSVLILVSGGLSTREIAGAVVPLTPDRRTPLSPACSPAPAPAPVPS